MNEPSGYQTVDRPLVEELRWSAENYHQCPDGGRCRVNDWEPVFTAAADEIDRLRQENARLRDEWRRWRVRAHDAEDQRDGQHHLTKRFLAEVDDCHRLIVRLWHRDAAWIDPEDPPSSEQGRHVDGNPLGWRQTGELLRALRKYAVDRPVENSDD